MHDTNTVVFFKISNKCNMNKTTMDVVHRCLHSDRAHILPKSCLNEPVVNVGTGPLKHMPQYM